MSIESDTIGSLRISGDDSIEFRNSDELRKFLIDQSEQWSRFLPRTAISKQGVVLQQAKDRCDIHYNQWSSWRDKLVSPAGASARRETVKELLSAAQMGVDECEVFVSASPTGSWLLSLHSRDADLACIALMLATKGGIGAHSRDTRELWPSIVGVMAASSKIEAFGQ